MNESKLRRRDIREPVDSPAYWIEIAKDAYVHGFEGALAAIMTLAELEAEGRMRIPACQWGQPKPYDLQDISRDVYDHWRTLDL